MSSEKVANTSTIGVNDVGVEFDQSEKNPAPVTSPAPVNNNIINPFDYGPNPLILIKYDEDLFTDINSRINTCNDSVVADVVNHVLNEVDAGLMQEKIKLFPDDGRIEIDDLQKDNEASKNAFEDKAKSKLFYLFGGVGESSKNHITGLKMIDVVNDYNNNCVKKKICKNYKLNNNGSLGFISLGMLINNDKSSDADVFTMPPANTYKQQSSGFGFLTNPSNVTQPTGLSNSSNSTKGGNGDNSLIELTLFNKDLVHIVYFSTGYMLIQKKDPDTTAEQLTTIDGKKNKCKEIFYRAILNRFDKEALLNELNALNAPTQGNDMSKVGGDVDKIAFNLYKYDVAGEPVLKLEVSDFTKNKIEDKNEIGGIFIDSTTPKEEVISHIKETINDEKTINSFNKAYNQTQKGVYIYKGEKEENNDVIKKLRIAARDGNIKPYTQEDVIDFINFINDNQKTWKTTNYKLKNYTAYGSVILNKLLGVAPSSVPINQEERSKKINDIMDALNNARLNVLSNTEKVTYTFPVDISNKCDDDSFGECTIAEGLLKSFYTLLSSAIIADLVIIEENMNNMEKILNDNFDGLERVFKVKIEGTFGLGINKKTVTGAEFATVLFNQLKKKASKSWLSWSSKGGKSRRVRKHKTKRSVKGGKKTRKHGRRRHTSKI
uniref:Uncharacterized protein n=1 Tax=viral metagenome TaxID=1070528 RepID=A0A6C0D633_9ZZZZ